jgi:hypothetical protein
VSQSAEARDEPSVACYLEALAAVAIRQDNLERAVHLLAAAGALLQAKGSGWLHAAEGARSRLSDVPDRTSLRGSSPGGSYGTGWRMRPL